MSPSAEIAAWAKSGAMALTGRPDGPPQLVAGAPATAVRNSLNALASTASAAGLDPTRLPDERLLSERAAVMGLRRRGSRSAGGATRLIRSADGTVAVTLSRATDLAAVPALVSRDALTDEPWAAVATWCRDRSSEEIVERATLLGLAAGAVDATLPVEPSLLDVSSGVEGRRRLGSTRPRVVDLSSLWAGPLCAHLLALLGADVTHVESTQRPDPTRDVAPSFHGLLRGGIDRIQLDINAADDLRRLHDLLLRSDIVIEASRPRALAQLGIDAHAIAAESGHCTWVSITAHGRQSNRIGFGDDVAAAAGLLGDGPVFAADAIADPMTGTHAALAGLSRWVSGSNGVIDISMYDVVRAARTPLAEADVISRDGAWYVDDGRALTEVRNPAPRPTT
jgi:hypothetical protein